MYCGELTKMDGDDAWTGHVASVDMDVEIALVPNGYKSLDAHPDYVIEARSPKGRVIRVGSAWAMRSRAGNEYLSLVLNLPNQAPVRVNAVVDERAEPGTYRIIPLSNVQSAA